MKCLLFMVFYFSLSVATYGHKDSVPVLVWNDDRILHPIPTVSALQVIPFTSFREKYLQSFPLENIVLFLQDVLSIEDLSSHANELKYVNERMETSKSTFLPAVEGPSHLEHWLPSHGYNVLTLKPGSGVGGINLKSGKNNLVLVDLPATKRNPSHKAALQKTSEVIENVISKIGKMADFTFIFTGKQPTLMDSAHDHQRIARSLQQTNVTDKLPQSLHRSDCVLLFLRKNILIFKDKSSYELNEQNSAGNDVGDCFKENIATIKLRHKNVGTLSKVTLELRFQRNSRRWRLMDAEIYEQTEDRETAVVYPKSRMEEVPLMKSYACAQPIELITSRNATTQYRVVINGMQVEAFTKGESRRFHDGWDCVGFFTIPIWMGILSGILFILILSFGLYMLSDVKTMDRFDDPKGKHFMIVATE